ncbi:MAG: hypothetical protein OXI34_01960 [Chloroflexota bacterium]|nr:hypothetical protein [Chloroflexota bacterium]MDE2853239.1 hypothetical protein [Chloroflexota bacterium]MDE2948841.1 hypothetical protein [Chloroflexota bacterium]
MDLLLLFIGASLIGAVMVVWVITWTSNRAAESAITRYFKASEHILETGQPPPEWLKGPARERLFRRRSKPAIDLRQLEQLDELIRFFENCSFYEDDFAREQHLAQLENVRQAWRAGPAG